MDIAKTQFLITDHGTHRTVQAFRRKRRSMLFQGDKPLRLIEHKDWLALKRQWPDECAKDKLSYRTVWTLEPIDIK